LWVLNIKTEVAKYLYWVVLWGFYVFRPFPVGLVASIAAFITEGLFIDPNVVAVPAEEVSSVMNVKSLVNMGGWREIRRRETMVYTGYEAYPQNHRTATRFRRVWKFWRGAGQTNPSSYSWSNGQRCQR
jgi:hypothetical protein